MKNRKNVFTCGVGHKTVTIDADEGVQPMNIRCTKEDCKLQAVSSWYQVEQTLNPTHEFYRPGTNSGLSAQDARTVKDGGLLLRRIL